MIENTESGGSRIVMRKDLIIPKLETALDRLQLSTWCLFLKVLLRISELILTTLSMSKYPTQRIRMQRGKNGKTESIKIDIQDQVHDVVIICLGGK